MNLKIFFIVGAFAFTFISCNVDDESAITQKIEKIESSYFEGAIKNEGYSSYPKIETKASNNYVVNLSKKIDAEIEAMMVRRSNGRTLAVGDYDIGLPASAISYCPGEKIQIYMDCEDNNPATKVFPLGVANSPWSIDGNKNIRMYFCRVDGLAYMNGFNGLPSSYRYSSQHAVLKLGPLNPPGTYRLLRYFDNQDNNNKNSKIGNISPNIVDQNTTLTFHIVPQLLIYDLGVFFGGYDYSISTPGNSPVTLYDYYIDDEDNSNNNYYKVNDGGPQSGSNLSFISGGSNTSIKIVKRN